MRRARVIFVCLLLAELEQLPGQIGYPGQYPPGQYPPGQYPPGGYPPGTYPGGPGIPLPRRGKKKQTKDQNTNIAPTTEVSGMLRKLDSKLVVVQTEDNRIIAIKRSDKTKFLKDGDEMKPSALKPGDHLRVDATEDEEGFYFAVNVNFEKAGTSEERASASEPVEVILPSSKNDSGDRSAQKRGNNSANAGPGDDDPDRPVLRRKDSPAETAKSEPAPAAAATAASDDPDRPVLRRQDSPVETARSEPAPAKPVPPAPNPQAKAAAAAPEPDADTPPPLDKILNAPKPTPAARDADDPGPPKLARGKPTRRRTPEAPPTEVASARPPEPPAPIPAATREPEPESAPAPARPPEQMRQSSPRNDPVIEKTRDAAGTFTESLPNYVCQELMARFVNASHPVNWQPQDVVSTEVVYENGKERYRNLAINNKPVKKGMEELSGAWSTGEFGTVLIDLFSPSTDAHFRYRRESLASGRAALVYDFDVIQERSHWHVQSASQGYNPAYRGTVWIDKRNYRVLRIEMQAQHFPVEFPLDKVESATDYDYVRFGGEATFLMPVHAETLSCQRGTSLCAMNKIDFRNYHKYTGESTITFEKP